MAPPQRLGGVRVGHGLQTAHGDRGIDSSLTQTVHVYITIYIWNIYLYYESQPS